MSRSLTSSFSPILAALLTVAMLALPATAAQAGSRTVDTGSEATSFDLVNQERTARGLPALVSNAELVGLAREHSEAMAADVESGGACGDGVTLRHREDLKAGVTAKWTTLRENVGCGYGTHGTATVVHDGFMNSSGHRANILASDINQVGIGAFRDVDGGLWVTQIFMQAPLSSGSTATVAPTPETVRIGVAVSEKTFAAGAAEFAVVARADDFADSLGGAALGGGHAPILFTPAPTTTIPDPKLDALTRSEIDRVLGGSGTVYILGGTAAVGPAVESELKAAGYTVSRLKGSNRFETAVVIAEQIVRREGAPKTILVAYGGNWPDAVTGGAAAARNGLPVVLTGKDVVPASTAKFLAAHPGAKKIVLGGSAVVTDQVVRDIGAHRIAGAGRAETAIQVADQVFGPVSGSAVVLNGWSANGWASAMAWSAFAARGGAPQVMVSSDVIPAATESFLDKNATTLRYDAAVPSSIRTALEAALAA